MKKILENSFAMSQHLLDNPAVLDQPDWREKVLEDQYLKQKVKMARLDLAERLYDELSKEEKACLIKIPPPEVKRQMLEETCCNFMLYIYLKVYYSNDY